MTARQWLAGHRPRTRYARIRAELDALDRGLVETGLIAARAIERIDAHERALRAAFGYAGRTFPGERELMRPDLRVLPGGDAS